MLHNDAFGLITAGHLAEMGVNLFNFSFEHPVAEIRALADRIDKRVWVFGGGRVVTDGLLGALHEPFDGHVDPTLATHALAAGARAWGGEAPEKGDRRTLVELLVLVAALAALCALPVELP